MKLLPLALLVLVGLVSGAPVWKQNTEYTFEVYARTLTALPDLRDQYVGLVTRGVLKVQALSGNVLVGVLHEYEHASYHGDVPEVHTTLLDDQKLSYEQSPLQGATFVVHYKNGVVHSLDVDGKATNDEANQLKALVSQLQVDITGENLMKNKPNFLPPGNRPVGLYSVMEPVVTGECETLYQVSDLPSVIWPTLKPKWAPNTALNTTDNLFSVKKEYNYGNCKNRKGYHFGLTGDDLKPNTNQVGGLLSDVSTSLVIAMGNPKNFTVKYATTSEEVYVRAGLSDEQRAQVLSQMQLALLDVRPVKKELPRPNNPVNAGNLVYRYNRPSDPKNTLQTHEHLPLDTAQSRQRRSMEPMEPMRGMEMEERPMEEEDYRPSLNRRYRQQATQPHTNLSNAPEIPLSPLFVGYKGSMVQHSKKVNVEEVSYELAKDVAKGVLNPSKLPENYVLDKFSMLTSWVRVMNEEQVKAVASKVLAQSKMSPEILKKHNSQSEESHTFAQTFWQVYRDAVVEAGTSPAVLTVFDWVTSKQVEGEEAAQLLTALTKSVRVPHPELVRKFFDFCKSDEVKHDRRVHAAAVVAFTSFLEGVEVNKKHARNYYPSNSFQVDHKENEELLLKEVVPYFTKALDQAVHNKADQDTLLYVRALGNLGHPAVLPAFNTQLQNDTNLSEFQRVAVVFAFDRLVENYPKVAQHALHQLYFNVAENPQVRCAAVLQLLRSDPPANTVQYVAAFTQNDPHTHVQACTKSAVESAATLKLPEHYKLAKNAEAAKQHLTPVEFGPHYPVVKFKDYWLKNLQASHYREFSLLTSPESYYPNVFDYRAEDSVQGFTAQSFEFNAMMTSVDDLVAFFHGHLGKYHDGTPRRGRADPGFASKWTRKYVSDQLNVRPYVDEDVEGQLFLSAFGFQRYFAFDKKTFEQAPEKLVAALHNAGHVNYNKFHVAKPVEVGFPLATGHPLFFKSSVPGVFQVQGKVEVKLSDKKDALFSTVNVTAKGSVLYSATRQAHVGFFVPSLSQQFVAGYNKKFQVHVPLTAEFNFCAKETAVYGRVAFLEPKKDVVLFQAGSFPFTARKRVDALVPVAAAKELKKIHSRTPKGFQLCTGKDTTGSVYCFDAEYEWKHGDLLQLHDFLKDQDFSALSQWELPVGQNDYYDFKLVHVGSKSVNKGVRFTFKLSELYVANENVQEQPEQDDGVKLAYTSNTTPNNEERRHELGHNAASGLRDARVTVYDFSVVFEGAKQADFGFTFAKAKSSLPKFPKHRAVFNAFAHPVKPENAKQLCAAAWVNVAQVPKMNFEEALATDLKSKGVLELVFGPTCQSALTHYEAEFELNRSDKLKKEVSTSATAEHCREEMKHGHDLAPSCVNATYLASFLDHAVVDVHFEHPSDKFRNLTDFVHNYLRYKHFGHYTVDHGKKGKNHTVELEFFLNQNRRTVNATFQAPDYAEQYKEVPYSPALHGFFYLQPRVGYTKELGFADYYTCSLANNQVWTFDNATTQQHFGKCWYAMAHTVDDKGGRRHGYRHDPLDAFTVLVRGETGAQQKQVLVVVPQPGGGHDHTVRLSSAPGQVIAYALVDGKDHEMGEGSQVVKHDDGKNPLKDKPAFTVTGYKNEVTVFVRDGKVKLYYNERGVYVVAHKSYFRDVRGLCGNFNGEKYDDKLSPNNCGYEDEHFLAPSWSVGDDECSDEDKELRVKAEEAKCYKHYYVHNVFFPKNAQSPAHGSDSSSSSESSSESSESSEHGQTPVHPQQQPQQPEQKQQQPEQKQFVPRSCNPIPQVQLKLVAGQLCFTKEALNACPKHCMPVDVTVHRVPVHCRDASDSLAQLYKQQLQKGARVDLSAKETTKVLAFSVPRTCRAA